MARYRIIPGRSQFWFEARSSLHPIRVRSAAVSGYVEAEIGEGGIDLNSAPRGRVEVETQTLKTGNILYDRELERRLETRRFPHISGEILDVSEIQTGRRYRVRGKLTVRGVSRTVEGEVNLRCDSGDRIEVEGERIFDIREFGLEPPRILMLKVYPEVKVRGRVAAEKQS